MNLAELRKLAKSLGLSFTDETSEDVLKSMIGVKETENKQNNDVDFWRSEAKKAFDQRDRVKDDIKTLKNKLTSLESVNKGMVSSDALKDLQGELNSLKTFKKDIEDVAEEKRIANMDEVEKAKVRAEKAEGLLVSEVEKAKVSAKDSLQKQIDEMKATIEQDSKQIISLRANRLETDITKAAVKKGAISPSGVYRMLKDEFEYESDLGKFVHYDRDNKNKIVGEKDVNEFVDDFLVDENNDYLVRSDANRTSLDTTRQTTKSDSPNDGNYNPKDPVIVNKAEDAGLSPENYIRVQKLKDEKMKLVK